MSDMTAEATAVLDGIPKVAGETRAVYRCKSCGKLFGRRFIPYGLGHGATFGGCLCIITGNAARRELVLECHDEHESEAT